MQFNLAFKGLIGIPLCISGMPMTLNVRTMSKVKVKLAMSAPSGHMEVSGQLRALAGTEGGLGGPQSWSEHIGNEKNYSSVAGIEPWIIHPVAQSLYKLNSPGCSYFSVFVCKCW